MAHITIHNNSKNNLVTVKRYRKGKIDIEKIIQVEHTCIINIGTGIGMGHRLEIEEIAKD